MAEVLFDLLPFLFFFTMTTMLAAYMHAYMHGLLTDTLTEGACQQICLLGSVHNLLFIHDHGSVLGAGQSMYNPCLPSSACIIHARRRRILQVSAHATLTSAPYCVTDGLTRPD